MIDTPHVTEGGGRRVPAHLRCVSCSYPLRGLQSPGNCPECGAPLEASVLQPLLRKAAAESQQDDSPIARSVRRILVAFVAIIVIFGIMALILILLL